MNQQQKLEQKLADWKSAFYSTNDLQGNKILKDLIDDLRSKIGGSRILVQSGELN